MRRITQLYRVPDSEKRSHLAMLRDVAHFMPRQISPFEDFSSLFVTGMNIWQLAPQSELEIINAIKAMRKLKLNVARYYFWVFEELLNEHIIFSSYVERLKNRPKDIILMGRFLAFHARAARATDIRTLKVELPKFLETVELPAHKIPPLTPAEYSNKECNCGFYSTCTARLLVNINERDEFDRAPDLYRNRRIAKTPAVKNQRLRDDPATDENSTFPSFLFPDDLQYRLEDPARGIFKSRIMLKCVRTLLMGATAADRPAGSRGTDRSSLAKKYHVHCVSAAILAYVAILVRFLLDSKPEWDGDNPNGSGKTLHGDLLEFLGVQSGFLGTHMETTSCDSSASSKRRPHFTYDDNDNTNLNSGPDREPNVRERALAMRRAQLLEKFEATLELGDDKERAMSEGVSYIGDDTGPGSHASPLEVSGTLCTAMAGSAFDATGSSSDAQVSGSDGTSA
ncbi:hypothetical protein DICSQDRAFT_175168 [Dichomitus squalens LYAD-421 SS1]|uniref:Uncharacterized protein n=1 Tax=Dichomitus squalens (strain LYAD-421) TaxID=732165 RepID=R7SK90_DICSQ|nr:uncharacterized protein DICSQDRAFT_175168 [Dichomitus squalens LYAD-421 SS1]EJF56150.1 hypothetical protein DICSQDRAFT_175168 [Dichomitus squalens LYAD-421 SS1]